MQGVQDNETQDGAESRREPEPRLTRAGAIEGEEFIWKNFLCPDIAIRVLVGETSRIKMKFSFPPGVWQDTFHTGNQVVSRASVR